MAKRKLSSVSTADIRAEIDRRARDLQRRREHLTAELQEVENELAGMGGTTPQRTGRRTSKARTSQKRSAGGRPKGRPRGSRSGSLVAIMEQVMSKDKPMTVSEVTEAVKKAGYQSSANNFRLIVNQALINNTDRFKKVDRGKYALA